MSDLVTAAVSAVLGGLAGWLVVLVRSRRERRATSGDDAARAIRTAMTELYRLRSLYQDTVIGRAFRRPSEREVAAQENVLLGACDQAAVEELADAVRTYLRVGRAYASGDEDTGAVQEEVAGDELTTLMRRLVREAQSF